jgi:diketogulonate reductase-like aldo/keto reductase
MTSYASDVYFHLNMKIIEDLNANQILIFFHPLRHRFLRYLDSMMLLLPNNAWIAAMKDQLKPDPSDPVQMSDRVDVWNALAEAVSSGAIKSAGISNCNAQHVDILLESIAKSGSVKPVYNQIETHPLYVDDECIKLCQQEGILIQAYAPFAKGVDKLSENATLKAIAERNGVDVHQLIMLWCVEKGFVVIPRSELNYLIFVYRIT